MDVEVSTGQNVMFVIITVFHVHQSDCWSIRNSVKHISKNKQCKYLNNTGTYISKKNTTLDTNRLFLKRKIFVQGRSHLGCEGKSHCNVDSLVPVENWKCFCSNAEGAGKESRRNLAFSSRYFMQNTQIQETGKTDLLRYKIVAVVYVSV